MALCQLLGKLRDKNGRVTVPGFYDGVQPLSAFERKQFARLPFNARDYQKFLGVPKLFGERGFTPLEQRSARPTLEINGLTSGYQGEGSKTIVPAWARAKITVRLVPNQNPDRVLKRIRHHLREAVPAHGAPGNRIGPRGGALPRFTYWPTGASCLARPEVGLRLRAGADPRGRLNPHR